MSCTAAESLLVRLGGDGSPAAMRLFDVSEFATDILLAMASRKELALARRAIHQGGTVENMRRFLHRSIQRHAAGWLGGSEDVYQLVEFVRILFSDEQEDENNFQKEDIDTRRALQRQVASLWWGEHNITTTSSLSENHLPTKQQQSELWFHLLLVQRSGPDSHFWDVADWVDLANKLCHKCVENQVGFVRAALGYRHHVSGDPGMQLLVDKCLPTKINGGTNDDKMLCHLQMDAMRLFSVLVLCSDESLAKQVVQALHKAKAVPKISYTIGQCVDRQQNLEREVSNDENSESSTPTDFWLLNAKLLHESRALLDTMSKQENSIAQDLAVLDVERQLPEKPNTLP